MSNPNEVTLSLDEYLELQDEVDFLNCLRLAGVDNWEGYDNAIDAYQETHDTEE